MEYLQLKRILAMVLLMILIGVFNINANERTNLVEKEVVFLEQEPMKGPFVSDVQVFQEEKELVIHGKVVNPPPYNAPKSTRHVYITVIDPDGKLLADKIVTYRQETSNIRKKMQSLFHARIPLVVQEGTIVRVMHHSQAHEAEQKH